MFNRKYIDSIRVHFPGSYVSLLEGTYLVGKSSTLFCKMKKPLDQKSNVFTEICRMASISFCGPRWLSEEGASIFDQSCWQLEGSSVGKWLISMVNKFPK